MVLIGAGNLEVSLPSFRHGWEAIYGSFSANFATKDFSEAYLYLLHLQIVKTLPSAHCKREETAVENGF